PWSVRPSAWYLRTRTGRLVRRYKILGGTQPFPAVYTHRMAECSSSRTFSHRYLSHRRFGSVLGWETGTSTAPSSRYLGWKAASQAAAASADSDRSRHSVRAW